MPGHSDNQTQDVFLFQIFHPRIPPATRIQEGLRTRIYCRKRSYFPKPRVCLYCYTG